MKIYWKATGELLTNQNALFNGNIKLTMNIWFRCQTICGKIPST